MKKIISLFCVVFIFFTSSINVFAAESAQVKPYTEISVEITSPTYIESKPKHDANIEIKVKNLTDKEITGLDCYLIVVDMGKKMSLNVDEFGSNAYQTRRIESLAPNSECIVSIPISIIYVGNFKLTASVMNAEKNYVITSDPLTAEMIATSKLNKPVVVTIAIIMPIILGIGALLLTKRKSRK